MQTARAARDRLAATIALQARTLALSNRVESVVAEALEHVRDLRDNFVDRVLSNSSDNFPEGMLIDSYARFLEPNLLETADGQRVRAGSSWFGHPAFELSEEATFSKLLNEQYTDPAAVKPDLRQGVCLAIRHCLVADRRERLPDCAALRDVLAAFNEFYYFLGNGIKS